MAHVRTVAPADAAGELALVYREIAGERGGVAAIHRAASLRPDLVRAHFDFYRQILFAEAGLDRALRERLAVWVSEANECLYCQTHHAEALCKIATPSADLTPREQALRAFTNRLTLTPGAASAEDVARLREAGLTEAEVVDAVFVISYFNFANRVVDGLGVELESDYVKTCR